MAHRLIYTHTHCQAARESLRRCHCVPYRSGRLEDTCPERERQKALSPYSLGRTEQSARNAIGGKNNGISTTVY